ncbi:pectinesterase-like [Typha angustifolia]|uniref:pectinesterase-like n=1 Tax=Typha angustifolia TaxID=59011 RepID=UPI003C2E36C1
MHIPTSLLVIAILISFLSLLYPSISYPEGGEDDSGIDRWCEATPHPGPCRYYLRHGPSAGRENLYQLSLKLTVNLTDHAQSHLKRLGVRCQSNAERKAWLDCWRLYTNAALQLNRTLHRSSNATCSQLDTQTWLSAALTNLETCRKGFAELAAPDGFVEPVFRYNVSDLISNLLAVNKNNSNTTIAVSDAPGWMQLANRRLLQLKSTRANLVVARDGSGNFRTIKDAVNAAAAQRRKGRFVIYVKAGVYNENVQVVSSFNDLTLIGDGIGKTIITGSRSVANGYTTFSSPTFSVFGDGFIATGITFRNTFGPGSQAVALLSGSDRSIFYRCSIEGYQDTLCVFSQRQFYRECDIYGTIDFIFGNAAAVIQNCNIYARKPRHGESNVITAQGRSDPNQNTGIVIHSSRIRGTPEYWLVHRTVKTYLGRPWMQYSRTVYIRNYIDSIIDPVGWLPFNGNFALSTLFYAEYGNSGPGSRLSMRVRWPGYHIFARPLYVRQFSVGRFIAGRTWIRSTGVPYNLGL